METVVAKTLSYGVPEEAISSNMGAYFSRLHHLLSGVAVSAFGAEQLSAEEGVRKAVELIASAKLNSGKVIVVGNGGSASIASHMALDLWNAAGVKSLTFNESSQLTCLSNDYGYEQAFSKALEMFGEENDVLIAISSSGRSQNIINAVRTSRDIGLKVISYSGFCKQAPLVTVSDLNFFIDSDEYGCVEVAHMALTHHLTDVLANMRQAEKS